MVCQFKPIFRSTTTTEDHHRELAVTVRTTFAREFTQLVLLADWRYEEEIHRYSGSDEKKDVLVTGVN